MKKYFLPGLILLMLLNSGYAQLYRQVDKNLNTYYKLNPSAKISLLFNQPGYSPGDTAFFLVRFVSAVDLKPIRKKSTLHLVLVNKNGENAFNQFFFVEDGIAANQIIIPPTLPAGPYTLLCLRPQSNSPDPVYQQYFEIIGAQKNVVVDTVRSISVFPEGGSIIEGAENKVFVNVHSAGSLPLRVIDGSNREVGSFTTTPNGIGVFFLKPTSGQTFHLSGMLNGKAIQVPLPITKKHGASFSSIVINGKLKVSGKVFDFRGKPEIILIRNDRVYYAEKLTLDSLHSFSCEISLGETLKGLFQLWIIDTDKVLASRILYSDPENEGEGLIVTHAKTFHPRSKVEILVSKNDTLMKGSVSMRVYQKALFPISTRNIFSNLELLNDLPLFSGFDGEMESLNDFLATQRWQRYHMDSITKGKFRVRKVSFDQGYIINGKCTGTSRIENQKPPIVTFYFENSNFLEEAPVDKNGNFSMELSEPIAQNEKVYYRVDVGETEWIDATLEVAHSGRILPVIPTRPSKESNPYYAYKGLVDSIQRSYHYFNGASVKTQPDPKRVKSLEAKSYGADKVYDLNDYKTFSSMKEVIVEILGKVVLKKINGKNAVRIYLEDRDNPNPVLARGDPLFILDGIPTRSTDSFLDLKPSMIEKIKIIWKPERSVLEAFGRNGVIIVETREGNLSGTPPLPSFELAGFSPPLPFKPLQQVSDQRFPYFRSCLYWNPDLAFTKDGVSRCTFFTADDIGEYIIEVEALTLDGAPYFHRSTLVVAPEK